MHNCWQAGIQQTGEFCLTVCVWRTHFLRNQCQRLVTPTVLECAPKKIVGCEVHVTVLKSEMDQVRHQRPLSWTPMQNSTGRTPLLAVVHSVPVRGESAWGISRITHSWFQRHWTLLSSMMPMPSGQDVDFGSLAYDCQSDGVMVPWPRLLWWVIEQVSGSFYRHSGHCCYHYCHVYSTNPSENVWRLMRKDQVLDEVFEKVVPVLLKYIAGCVK